MEAERLHGEKSKRKGKWSDWVHDEIDRMSPPKYQGLVRAELKKLEVRTQ